MNQSQITLGKRLIEGYWVSVIIVAALFFDTTIGYYYTLGGVLTFGAHLVEVFIFDKALKEHSKNLMRDRLLVLPYGLLVPNELKLNKSN